MQSPRDAPLPSPRTRIGASGFDGGVLDGSWTSKRRAAEAAARAGGKIEREPEKPGTDEKINEEEESNLDGQLHSDQPSVSSGQIPAPASQVTPVQSTDVPSDNPSTASVSVNSAVINAVPNGPPPGLDLAGIEWSYLDPQGQVQGERAF